MDKIIEYFVSDPLKILYFLGGTGGISFWISMWRDRVRIKVRILKDGSFISDSLEEHSFFQCEIENVGGRSTSLEPTVFMSGYSPHGKCKLCEGKIAGVDRDLSPHKAKVISVDFPISETEYNFLLFRTYNFCLTRGLSKSIRVWSASNRIIGRFRFYYECILFRLFKKYNEPKT